MVAGKKQRVKDILMKKKNLNLKDNEGRGKSEKCLQGDHSILSFQRVDFFYVYKALETTEKVRFPFLIWRRGCAVKPAP